MRMLLSVAVACLALASCQSSSPFVNTAVANLPQACAAAKEAHTRFREVAATGVVPSELVLSANAAWAVAAPICQNAAQVAAAAQALAEVEAARRAAEAALAAQ